MIAVREIIFLLLTMSAGPVSDAITEAATTEEVVNYGVVFRSEEVFINALGDPASLAFQNRANLLQTELVPPLQNEFPSYRSFRVLAFRDKDIENIMWVGFASASAPNETLVEDLLVRLSRNITAFDIDTTFITVNGFGSGIGSSGVNHKISLITAVCLVLLSWFLTNQH